MDHPIQAALSLIQSVKGKPLLQTERSAKAVELASYLLEAINQETNREEKKREKWLAQMMSEPKGRAFLTSMTDQCFRSHSESRSVNQMRFLLKKFGIPGFLDERDRFKFLLFSLFGEKFPKLSNHFIQKKIREDVSNILLPENSEKEWAFLKKNWEEGVRVNLNHLGEAILGEEEAEKRLNLYLDDLKNPQVEYISIKISSIYSQINLIGWETSLEKLAQKMRKIYRTSLENFFLTKNGSRIPKFVNLDMEEYRDLDLTVALFQKVLSEPEFHHYQAGIVLQSYLPDSFTIQKQLTTWAINRVQHGGAPIKIRLVKGANLAMESVESSQRGWTLPIYDEKNLTDANFKRMMVFGADFKHAQSVHLGIASHNLFDIAYALLVRSENQTEGWIGFEMLQGMAEPMKRVLLKLSLPVTIYCPLAQERDFQTVLAYLMRRLDENSGPDNFLRHIFNLNLESQEWKKLTHQFLLSCKKIPSLPEEKRRKQNRLQKPPAHNLNESFKNEPDTDFSLEENRKWAKELLLEWKERKISDIPLVIAGKEFHEENQQKGIDPSHPKIPIYRASLADHEQIDAALICAQKQEKIWGELPHQERSELLGKVAQKFRENRKAIIGAMVADGGKTILEADPEVSEAIDFIEYYRKNWEEFLAFYNLKLTPKGTILVAPPWNFPCSIPAGGIAAALTTGNCVLFKPAPEAILVGWEVVKSFWAGGISKEVLQFMPCPDEPVGSALIRDPRLSAVILTGSTETALKMKSLRPNLNLHAETGGKNALIITDMADKDLAISHLIQSAFGHAGQKCSACSLAILEAPVYDNPNFLRHLKDGVQSMIVDSAWNPNTKVNPLISTPSQKLYKGLTHLDPGESWLVKPNVHPENPHLWSPGIKMGVQAGSFMHQTELFGPILAIMRARDLEHAIELANGTPYGLTSGLHSLDEREQALWKKKIIAGNLYINRSITGAIVRRQPFGGCKASSVGEGAKAGGPDYLINLVDVEQTSLPEEKGKLPAHIVPMMTVLNAFHLTKEEREIWQKSVESYAYWNEILKKSSDPSRVLGQNNDYYHVPLSEMTLRIQKNSSTLDLLRVAAACLICKTPLKISTDYQLDGFGQIPGIEVVVESEAEFIPKISFGRLRCLDIPSEKIYQKSAEVGATLVTAPVLANGRVELLHYLRSISLSVDYHRYGYLGS